MLFVFTLQHAARSFPSAKAIAAHESSLTFRDLETRAGRLSALFLEKGIGQGDRVAMLVPNSPEFIEIVYACARAGVIVVPLNTRFSQPEIDAVLTDCTPKAIFRHSALPAPTVSIPWQVVVDQTPLAMPDTVAPPPFYDPQAVFGLFYTSGTTGKPKGVMLTHANLMANMQNSRPYFLSSVGDCYLHAAPMFHLADFPNLLSTVAGGATQATIPRFELQTFCAAVEQHRVTHTTLIPTMINFLTLYQDLRSFDFSSLRAILYGGSPIAPEVLVRAREIFHGTRFMQGYGLTEASPLLTLLRDEDHTEDRLMSCGRPIVGVDLRIADENGDPVPPGEPGEILARGANVMKGYWHQPTETARTIRDGWLHTGDIAQQDEEGFVFIVDRAKDMIVTGGENVYSTEVEAVLYAHEAIKEAAVIGVPDSQWGEMVTACVVLREGCSATAEELSLHCRAKLANYKIPRRVEFFESELPKSGTGKILKRALREPFWKGKTRSV